jgi:hypothetical protein
MNTETASSPRVCATTASKFALSDSGITFRFRAPKTTHIGSVDPDALKIPARRAECSLAESALSPFQAEPTHPLAVVVSESKFEHEANASFLLSLMYRCQ